MNKNFVALNKLPESTYRFLKVNDITLKDVLIPEKSVELPPLPIRDDVVLRDCNNGVLNFSFANKNFVSKEDAGFFSKEGKAGFYLEVSKKADEIITLNYDFSKEDESLISNNIIYIKENSSAHVLLNYNGPKDSYQFLYSTLTIIVEKNASLKLTRVQTLGDKSVNIEGINSTVSENGNLDITSIDLGGNKNIVNFNNVLEGENSNADLNLLYLGDKDKIIDISKYMDFKGQNSRGNMITKGALLGNSKKSLKFTLDFKKGSKKSEGNEEEYVMLLSKKAKNASIPLLLAGENDVKGNHAASVGRIDEDTLFYLMSRGLSEAEGKSLIIKGAFASIIDTLPNEELKETILKEIESRVVLGE